MKKFNSKKHIALSLVALILVLMLTVGITYSWIDDLKQVEIKTNQNGVDAPLKTGVDINSNVKVTSKDTTIDLGKMLEPDDFEYTYEDTDGKTKSHIKYDHAQENQNRDPNWTDINNKKGYFYESGDMHLSGCYSDGETFYFPKNNGGYREGNKDDENVNYISFTVKVQSPDADVDFWFRSLPVIKNHNTDESISQARFAISADGKSHIYSASGTAKTCNSSLTGTTNVSGVRKTAVYQYGNTQNKTDERGENSNTLFSVKKGDTVYLNIKIWLEGGFDADITASDINFQLVSSWAYTRDIKIVDKTMGPSGASWIGNDGAKLYLTLPSALKSLDSSVSSWNSLDNDYSFAPFYELTLDSGSTDTYTAKNVPLVYNNEEMIIYRCTEKGWNKKASSNGDEAVQRSPYNVYCWNWWKSSLPNNFKDNETYTLYGCSLDNSAHSAFSTVTATNEGYGTWGGVELIKVYEHYYNTHYASLDDSQKMFLRDYSDYDTSQKVYTYEMYRKDNDKDNPWQTYVPKSSALLQFNYFNKNYNLQGQWGYSTWDGNCPQQRPLKNNIYSSNSTVYNLAGNDSSNSNKSYGRGFWENANYVYLIKNGNMSPSNVTPYANMLDNDNNKFNGNEQMTVLRNADNTANVTYSASNTPVYKSTTVQASNSRSIYKDVNFNNNYKDANDNWTVQSGNKNLYPGCFYNFSDGTWMGSLSGTGRSATTSGDAEGSGGSSSSGNTMTISTSMNGAGVYLYGSLDDTTTTGQLAKMTETSSGVYSGNLHLTASSNNRQYYIHVREATDSQHWTDYGDNENYKVVLKQSMTSEDYNLTGSQPLYLRVEDTGTYKFTYNKSQHQIVITKAN